MNDMIELFYAEHVNLDPGIEDGKRALVDREWTNTVYARDGRAGTQYKREGTNFGEQYLKPFHRTGKPFAEMRSELRYMNGFWAELDAGVSAELCGRCGYRHAYEWIAPGGARIRECDACAPWNWDGPDREAEERATAAWHEANRAEWLRARRAAEPRA